MKVSAFKMKLTKKTNIKNTFQSVICHTVLLLIWVKNNDEKSFQKNKFPKKFLSLFFNHNQKKQFSGKPLPLLQLFIICVFFSSFHCLTPRRKKNDPGLKLDLFFIFFFCDFLRFIVINNNNPTVTARVNYNNNSRIFYGSGFLLLFQAFFRRKMSCFLTNKLTN